MDYSKLGYGLATSYTNNEKKYGRNPYSNNPIVISNDVLKGCDTVLIRNKDSVKSCCDGKTITQASASLNLLGEILHKLQAVYQYQSYYLSPEKFEEYIKSLKLPNLCKSFKEHGMDGAYTFLLNKQASGTTIEDFEKIDKYLKGKMQELKLDKPDVEIKMKGVVKKSDFDYLPWKYYGHLAPQEVKMVDFNDNSFRVTNEYQTKHKITDRIPDGFRDAGHHVKYLRDGSTDMPAIARETIYVDRKNDPMLKKVIDEFKSIVDKNPYLSYEERIKLIYTYVREIFSIQDSYKLADEFRLHPMNIGDIMASGAGVCRHQALVTKLLGDEIGLNISLNRGRLQDNNGYKGCHIWNEVLLPNGQKYIVDTINRKFIDTDSKDKFLDRYHTIDGAKYYKE